MKNNPCSPLMDLLQYIYVPPVPGNSSPGGVPPVLSGDERSPPTASPRKLRMMLDTFVTRVHTKSSLGRVPLLPPLVPLPFYV